MIKKIKKKKIINPEKFHPTAGGLARSSWQGKAEEREVERDIELWLQEGIST